MSSILGKIKNEKKKKKAKIVINIDEVLKSKIEYICSNNDVNISIYIEKILESSEINRMFLATEKEVKLNTSNANNNSELEDK